MAVQGDTRARPYRDKVCRAGLSKLEQHDEQLQQLHYDQSKTVT